MDFEELNLKLNDIKQKIKILKETIKIDEKESTLKSLEDKTMQDGFWSDSKLQEEVLGKIKYIKDEQEKFANLEKNFEDAKAYYDLARELIDIESYNESNKLCKSLLEKIEKMEISTLLNGEYDNLNAIITIHPGAGGTESQDWALMLYRMYTRWCERNSYSTEVLDFQDGDEAGIKSVSFIVKGNNAFGYLKSENGVHRLVRISPFDANSRRHTSFAAVEVMPEISDKIDIQINPEDIKMDVYRASGAGGQHVNKTSSAVRLTHIPTGIVAACQTERSQFQNKDYAMKMLKSKLYEMEQEKKNKEITSTRRLQVGSGARSEKIRTYNYPQSRVTDHRINLTIYQLESFLNGNLDEMIEALIAADRADRLKEGNI